MNIYTLLASGKYHPVNGEDAQFHRLIGERWIIAAVMDGCSSAVESHFASAVMVKSLRKTCAMLPNRKELLPDFNRELVSSDSVSMFILRQLFEDVKKTRKLFSLDIEELLSTILLLVFDKKTRSAKVVISGDGYVACNGEVQEIDQRNMPDYLGYHINISFDEWLTEHTIRRKFNDIADISISTDGINKIGTNQIRNPKPLDPVQLFLIDKPLGDSRTALFEQYRTLVGSKDYVAYDDISVIRLIV